MRVLLTGAGGQLGQELSELLPGSGHEVAAFARSDLDITDPEAVHRAVEEHLPNVVINAAAYTDVDGCETEQDLAYAVNALGPRNLAASCESAGCAILHVSTNYVFDGEASQAYKPSDPTNPVNVYGRTKLAGEEYVIGLSTRWYVVRTAGIYGSGKNFVRTMLRLGSERKEIQVKDDEFVSPTYARDLAWGIRQLIEDDSYDYGLYHLTNAGSCSWYECAVETFRLSGIRTRVSPVKSADYPLTAARPANGILYNVYGPPLRHWRDALYDYLENGTGRGG